MKPTITIMSRLFWPQLFGGLEHALWRLSNALIDQGAEISVLTQQAEGVPDDQVVRPGLRVHRVPPVEVGRLWRVGELLQARAWRQALRHAPPSGWLWANEPTAAAAAIRAGRAKDLIYRPVFCYDAMHRVAQTHPEMRGLRRTRLSRRLDRACYRRAAIVIDESDNLRDQQRRHYGDRPGVYTVRNGVAAPGPGYARREAFGLTPGQFVIGFVGRPGDPCKDLPFLIKALCARPLPSHARLLFVGGGAGLQQARRWVREAGLEHRTRWTGVLPDPSPAYRAMDVLVLPSRFETFGNVIVEAHAHGVPAIGRRRDADAPAPIHTACEELIDQARTGFTVDPHDPADLADALHRLIAQPALARAMGHAAASQAAQNTWHDTARRYLELLGLQTAARPTPIHRAA